MTSFTSGFDLSLALKASVGWAIAWPLLKIMVSKFSELCFSAMPPEKAWLPLDLPHPNPAGDTVPFPLKLTDATPEQCVAFMVFRGKSWKPADGLQPVAVECAKYKGDQFDEKTMKWEDDHFRLQLPNLRFPVAAKHWNGFAGWFMEIGSFQRDGYVGKACVFIEHIIFGMRFRAT